MSTETFQSRRDFIASDPGRSRALSALEADMSGPFIGTAAFHDLAMMQCADAAQSAGSRSAMQRYQRLARGVGRLVASPFALHTIGSLAAAAGMSRSSFAHCFSAVFKRPPLEFLKAERLRFAAHLVRTTSLPIKAIAGQVGYASHSFLSRSFQARYGVAPSTVRHLVSLWSAPPAAAERNGKSAPDAAGHGARSALSHDELRFLCRAAQDVMWDIDLTTGQVWWSEGMSNVFGYGRDQVGPDTTWCHAHIHPEDRDRVVACMQRACADGDVLWRDTFRYRRADGSYARVADRGVIMRDASGRAVRFMGIMLDISVDIDCPSLCMPDRA